MVTHFAVAGLCLPMAFDGPVPVPFLTELAPHHITADTLDDGFVGGKHGGLQIDNSEFTDGNFHSA